MIRFHYSLAPNPMKVALFLEEAGLPYEGVPVDTRKGEQFAPAFAALNPNNKVPVIEDGEATVFDSNAILLYLAEKTGRFLPRERTPAARGKPQLKRAVVGHMRKLSKSPARIRSYFRHHTFRYAA